MVKLLLLILLTSCAAAPVKTELPVELEDKFTYKSTLTFIKKTTECANKLFRYQPFLDELKAKESFDFTEDTGLVVYNKMMSHKSVIRSYRTTSPWSKAVATTHLSNNVDVYLNSRKKREIYLWTGTAFHEDSHNYGYSHGNNNKTGKDNAVPYWLGYMASRHAKELCK